MTDPLSVSASAVNDADCAHRGCEADDVELQVCAASAFALGDDEFRRVCSAERPGAVPDFRSPRHSLQVKRLISPVLQEFLSTYDRQFPNPHRPIEGLTQYWLVFADLTDAIDSFSSAVPAPRIDALIGLLTPLLADLETRGVVDAFGDGRVWPELRKLLGHGAQCRVVPNKPPNVKPGVHLAVSYGHSRSTYLEDDVVAFLQCWLDSEYSQKACRSLENEHRRKKVIAVAPSLDGPAAAMLRTLSETFGAAISRRLNLPPGLDALLVVTGPEVIHFDNERGWVRHRNILDS